MTKHINNKPLKVLACLFVIFFVIVAGYEYIQYGSIFNNTEHFRKIYSEAVDLKNNEEYSAAFTRLEDISPRYEAYDAVLYQQAQCAAKTGDEASVQKRLKALITKYPQSYLYIPSKYDLAKSYLRSNNNDLASDTFQNIVNSHGGTDYEIGSYYYLGELNSDKNKQAAVKYWKKYISLSQDGRFSSDCVSRILASEAELSPEDNLFVGIVFLNAKNYEEAVKYFSNADVRKNWYYLGKISIYRNNFADAKDYIFNGVSDYASEFSQDELGDILYALAGISPAPAQFWKELTLLNRPKVADIALFNYAKYLPVAEANDAYKKIVDEHIKGSYSSEALKNLFWNAYKSGQFVAAKEYATKHINSFNTTKSAPEMNFWLGKIYEKEGNRDAALKSYNRIILKYPDDYYAFRAYGRITYLTKGVDFGWDMGYNSPIKNEHFVLELPYSYSEIKTKFGATLAELLLVEDFTTIDYFNDFKEPFIESWIYYKKGLSSTSTTTARNAMEEYPDKPDRTDKKWNFVYPCYFAAEVNKYSQRNKISPYILIALIREESYFNPLALSGSNAVGLTQILPSTAREVSERRGYGIINEFLLFNPEINIKYGSAYYAQIKKQMDDNNLYAVASYNGGAGALSSWLKKTNAADMDEFVEYIPYDETKNYIKKVFRSYWNYVRLYGEQ
ncbi:MAG: transglycosylase SLT domain-containing protein [bacterium]|nr:transglycosylase SLT domain-containing protein [bacterium]